MAKKKTVKKRTMAANKNGISMKFAVKVSDQVDLHTVKLLACACKQETDCPSGQKTFDIQRTIRFDIKKEQKIIGVFTTFVLNAFGEGVEQKKENSFLEIEATFLLLYNIKSLEGLDDDAFRSFSELNGVYNAWPYWREFVQNVTSRMELPTLTVPVFRIVPLKPPKKTKKSNTQRKKQGKKKVKRVEAKTKSSKKSR